MHDTGPNGGRIHYLHLKFARYLDQKRRVERSSVLFITFSPPPPPPAWYMGLYEVLSITCCCPAGIYSSAITIDPLEYWNYNILDWGRRKCRLFKHSDTVSRPLDPSSSLTDFLSLSLSLSSASAFNECFLAFLRLTRDFILFFFTDFFLLTPLS